MPHALAKLLKSTAWQREPSPGTGKSLAADGKAADSEAAGGSASASRFMPEPRAVAVAVMALLAFGVIIGSVTDPLAQSASFSPILLETRSSPAPSEPVAPTTSAVAEAPLPAPAAAAPETAPIVQQPASGPPPTEPPSKPKPEKFIPEPGLPPIKHVFMIVLADHGYEEAFGLESTAPYLAKSLTEKGSCFPTTTA